MLEASIFSFFPTMFSTLPKQNFNFSATSILLPANAFNLNQSKYLWFTTVFIPYQQNEIYTSPNWMDLETTNYMFLNCEIYFTNGRKHWEKGRKCWWLAFTVFNPFSTMLFKRSFKGLLSRSPKQLCDTEIKRTRVPWWPWIAHLSQFPHKMNSTFSITVVPTYDPRDGASFDPRGIIWIELIKVQIS